MPHAGWYIRSSPRRNSYRSTTSRYGVHAVAVPELDVLGHKLNGTSLAVSISELAKRTGAPLSLAAIGMPKDGLDRAAELAVSNPYFNPRDFSQGDIRELLENAFHGTPLEQ